MRAFPFVHTYMFHTCFACDGVKATSIVVLKSKTLNENQTLETRKAN